MSPIGITKPQVSEDEETTKLMVAGLNQGLQSHVAQLFTVLCSGSASSDGATAALGRFSNGINLAKRIYYDARLIIEEEGL